MKAANLPLPGYKARELVQNLTTTEDGRISFDEFISVSEILFQRINTEEDKKKKKDHFKITEFVGNFQFIVLAENTISTKLTFSVGKYLFFPKMFSLSVVFRVVPGAQESHEHRVSWAYHLANVFVCWRRQEQGVTKLEILQLAGTN